MDILKLLGIEPDLLITQVIGFLILMGLLWRFGFKPLMNVLEARQNDIKATYDQLDADRDAMVSARNEYEQRLAGIEAEAREQIQAAVKEAQALRDQIIADAHKQAESVIERGVVESRKEREKAFTEMRQEIVALAVAAASKVVGELMDAPRHTKLVDDFINTVGKADGGLNGSGPGQKGAVA